LPCFFFHAQAFGLGFLSLTRFLFHASAHVCEAKGGLFGAAASGIRLVAFATFGFNARSLFFGAASFSLLRSLSPRLFGALALLFYNLLSLCFFLAFFLFSGKATRVLFGVSPLLLGSQKHCRFFFLTLATRCLFFSLALCLRFYA
jgi:hypothetical protein